MIPTKKPRRWKWAQIEEHNNRSPNESESVLLNHNSSYHPWGCCVFPANSYHQTMPGQAVTGWRPLLLLPDRPHQRQWDEIALEQMKHELRKTPSQTTDTFAGYEMCAAITKPGLLSSWTFSWWPFIFMTLIYGTAALIQVNIRDVKMAQVALWFDLNFELIKLLFSSISTGKLSPKHNLCDPKVEKHWPNPTCYWTVTYFGLHQYNPLIFFPAAKRLVKIVSKDWNRHWQGYY